MLFDSHTHINNEGYSPEEREALAAEIEASDVSFAVDVGFNLESSALAAAHAGKYPWCYAAVGFHPHCAKDMDEESLALTAALAKKEKVVAIGEIGLDYYRNLSGADVQQLWFRRQIRLGLELGKPIIIHDRDASGDVMRILKEEGVFARERVSAFPAHPADGGPDARLLMHCFSSDRELARQYVKLGATISIAGPVTYRNNRKTVGVVEEIGIGRLLIETDAPYLTPEPFRGRPNSSPLVRHTAEKIAQIKGMGFEDVARATCINAKRFFGIE
ncbi:MAG: TatD family hydrolase [Clostridiales Family XIII bacterium]|jgi:TatD DNase family protein|nr:TatD family hydrolase [Clostridiales Family XIII bacterium]